ncbi:ABC transporter ATP-binding protein [Candidatus Pristimantibacillus sp. PTI5]|uniref:ABC transporter ATP-binding protein n=1 Tax=Candidatus Pristimantibacillus sp. PTI5 TaxID=3400422 RepID=UPI003B01F3C7
MIQAKRIHKQYESEGQIHAVLKGLELHIQKGEFVAIMGSSGSGKSTLLQLLGGLEQLTEGQILLDNVDLACLNERERTLFRRRKIGFVFQNYQLLPTLTVEENIAFPMYADGMSKWEATSRVNMLLEQVGLADRGKSFPSKLSGGEQQRVALARSLALGPRLILADEPTGNLDRKRGQEILQLLAKLHREDGLTIVMVTHDLYAAGFADRIITMQDGRLAQEVGKAAKSSDHQFLENCMAKFNA